MMGLTRMAIFLLRAPVKARVNVSLARARTVAFEILNLPLTLIVHDAGMGLCVFATAV